MATPPSSPRRPVDALLVAVPCLIAGASALAGVWLAALGGDQVALALLGFEVVTLVSSVLGVLLGLGLMGRQIAPGALSIAGAIMVGSVFASISVQHSFAGVSLKPFLLGRIGLSGVILLGAVWASIGLNAIAWRRLGLGVAFAGPVVIGLGAVLFGPARGVTNQIGSLPPSLLWALGMVGFVLVSIVFSVGVHLIIRAFDPELAPRLAGAIAPAKPKATESE